MILNPSVHGLVKEDLNVTLLFNADPAKRSLAVQAYDNDKKNISNRGNERRLKSRNLILDFFSDEFGKTDIKNEFEYIYSAFYANEVYKNEITEDPSTKLDGVKFASIASDCCGENYALSESAYTQKLDFLGANFCCTFNNNIGKVEHEGKAIIGRVKAALLKENQTFEWIESTNEFDYIVKSGNEYKPFFSPSTGSRFPKAVVKIN